MNVRTDAIKVSEFERAYDDIRVIDLDIKNGYY